MLGHAAITELQHECVCVRMYTVCMSLHMFQGAVEEILMVMFRDQIKVKQVNVLLLI